MGSNAGRREAALARGLAELREHPLIRNVEVSSWRESTALGGPTGQPAFLNGAAICETDLKPEALLDLLQATERSAGRVQHAAWGPRPLDLDLLLYQEVILQKPRLTLPHPRMAWRRFVLEPAAEVAASGPVPTMPGWSIATLLQHLNEHPPHFALLSGRSKNETACRLRRIAERTGIQCFHQCDGTDRRNALREFEKNASLLLQIGSLDDLPRGFHPKLLIADIDPESLSLGERQAVLAGVQRHDGPVLRSDLTHPGVSFEDEIVAAIEGMLR